MDNAIKDIIVTLDKEFKVADISRMLSIPERTVYDFLAKKTYGKWWAQREEKYKRSEATGKKAVYIPDTQVCVGVPLDHLIAAGNYVAQHRPDYLIVAGDWWDMPSLNRFATNIELEGTRIVEDIEAGNQAMELFIKHALVDPEYNPRMIYTVGNHDPQVRIPRAISHSPILEGLLPEDTDEFLESFGFEVYDYLDIAIIEGIRFAHYFINPHSAKKAPLGGAADSMLKNCGFSFVQGHTQGLKTAHHFLSDGTARLGIAAGSFYMHDEDYMGKQGNQAHWRGIIQLNDMQNGSADICELSLDYLLRKYL